MSMSRPEKLSHYGIVVIALAAVLVSIWQARETQAHNRLSVRPFLDTFSGWESESIWELKLSNYGIGPAVIERVEYEHAGKTYTRWDPVLRAAGLWEARRGSHTFGGRSYMPANRVISFLRLARTENGKPLGIRVRIRYQSVYEEPFLLEIKI